MRQGFQTSFRISPALRRAAVSLAVQVERIDKRFRRQWRASLDPKQLKAVCEITHGAAARLISSGRPVADFLEQVDYNGRRLAKLNVTPSAVLRALAGYDRLLDGLAQELTPLRSAVVLALNNAYYRVREEEAQAFFDLFRAELEARTLDDLLSRFGGILSRTFRAKAARLFFAAHDPAIVGRTPWSEGDPPVAHPAPDHRSSRTRDIRQRFILSGDRAESFIRDKSWLGRFGSYWSIPFFADGEPAGLIQLAFATRYEWLPRELELLEAVAERCLAAAEKARLTEEVRELAAHMFQVEEQERRRISRELHDEAGQTLLFARLQLEMLEKSAPADWAGRAALAQTRAVIERTIIEIRRILAALSPAVLEQLGLAAAIRQLTARFHTLGPARVRLRIALRRRLPSILETVAYRLVQECYHNIARHSAASHVKLSLRSTDCSLGLRIEDDGVGFDLETAVAQPNSFGLAGMRERVTLMGGSFEIRSRPGQGTAIAMTLPIRPLGAPVISTRKGNYGQDSSFSHR